MSMEKKDGKHLLLMVSTQMLFSPWSSGLRPKAETKKKTGHYNLQIIFLRGPEFFFKSEGETPIQAATDEVRNKLTKQHEEHKCADHLSFQNKEPDLQSQHLRFGDISTRP